VVTQSKGKTDKQHQVSLLIKNSILSDVTPAHVALVRTDVSEELYIVFLCSLLQLLVTANIAPSSSILATLMMEAIHFSETSVLTRATRRNIPDDGILHSRHSENLKSYIVY
jgi:hypothetical protein